MGWKRPDSSLQTTAAAPAKRKMPRYRYYKAGQFSSLLASWTTTQMTPSTMIRDQLEILRARSREQFANNDYARRFISLLKSNVVGHAGFSFQARTMYRNGNPDVTANEALERAYRRFGRKDFFHLQRHLCESEFDRLAVGALATDGEVFIRCVTNPQINEYGYTYELIDAPLIDVKHSGRASNGNTIMFGIEYDEYDRPVAYHVNKTPQAHPWQQYDSPVERVRFPASDIIHLFIPERIGQRRGIPWLATPMQRMVMLDGYEEAAVVAARAGASKALYYTMEDSADPRSAGIATDEDPETGELSESVVPGSANILPAGVSIGAYDPTYPHDQFPEFVKTTLRGIASGLGISYHKLAGDLSDVNFSAGRMGEFEDRELWKAIQNYMISSWKIPAYERWLDWCLKMRHLPIQNRPDTSLNPDNYDKYLAVSITGRRWQGIQPKEEALANQLKLQMRVTSPQRVIRDAGDDPDEVLDDWVKWNEKLSNNGLQSDLTMEASDDDDDEPENE